MQSFLASALDAVRDKRFFADTGSSRTKTRTIAIASGKGGAGKTSVAACLAWILAEQGRSVCLVDVDLGLCNVDVLLGLSAHYTLEDVVLGDIAVEQAITTVRPGLDVISGGSGAAALADLDPVRQKEFLNKIKRLENYDYLLLDNAPGIHRQVVAFCLAAREQIIVINPEPTSVTDGYALLKVLRNNGLHRPPFILLNRVPKFFDHATLMERFAGVCRKHLQAAILPLGTVPDDPVFRQAAAKSMLPVSLQPRSQGCMALSRIATLLGKRRNPEALYSNARAFWTESLATLFRGLDLPAEQCSLTGKGNKDELAGLIKRLDRLSMDVKRFEDEGGASSFSSSAKSDVLADRLAHVGGRLIAMARQMKRNGHAQKTRQGPHDGKMTDASPPASPTHPGPP